MNAAYSSQRFKYMRVDSQDPPFIVRSGILECEECGLEMDRDKNAAKNLNPYRARQNPAGCYLGETTTVVRQKFLRGPRQL